MDNLIYEDKPWVLSEDSYVGGWIKPLATLWPALLVFLALYFLIVRQTSLEMQLIFVLVGTLIILFLELETIASKYQIFNDRIRIVGWIFRLDISFSNIETTRVATSKDLWGFHYNLIPVYSGDDVLQIIRKHGLKINIIPKNRKLFLAKLNKAMNDYRGHYVSF